MLFRQAFCAASTCSASRACLLTGQYAHSNGMLGLAHRGWSLNDYSHHIVHTLRDAGYHSTLIGEQHISKRPDVIGYDHVVKIDDQPGRRRRAGHDRPAPRRARPSRSSCRSGSSRRTASSSSRCRATSTTSRPPPNLPDTPETRARHGRLRRQRPLARPRRRARCSTRSTRYGLADNTLVICTTDHGIAFPGAKATMTDRGIGVMLIMRGPGGFAGGKASDALVSHIDIYPTICELLGIPPPDWLQGVSLMPIVTRRGRRDPRRDLRRGHLPRRLRAAAGDPHAALEVRAPLRADRDGAGARQHRRQPEQGRLAAARAGPSASCSTPEQLYDLVFDPNEAANLIGDADLAPVRRRPARAGSSAGCATPTTRCCDGPVPPPPGRRVQRPRPALRRRPGDRVLGVRVTIPLVY